MTYASGQTASTEQEIDTDFVVLLKEKKEIKEKSTFYNTGYIVVLGSKAKSNGEEAQLDSFNIFDEKIIKEFESNPNGSKYPIAQFSFYEDGTLIKIDLPKDTEDRDKKILDGITKQITKCMEKDTDFIVAALSKIDEIGHTGDFSKTVEMIEYTDECLNNIMASADNNFYKVIIISTHGNVEEMINAENQTKKINTCNSVPFLITDKTLELLKGTLVNVAPTILSYMDLAIPESMKGVKILIKD